MALFGLLFSEANDYISTIKSRLKNVLICIFRFQKRLDVDVLDLWTFKLSLATVWAILKKLG